MRQLGSPGDALPQRVLPGRDGNGSLMADLMQEQSKITGRGQIGKQGGNASPSDFQIQHEDEERVQQDIEDAAKGDPQAGLPGMALRPDQMRQHGIERRRHGAQADAVKHIGGRIAEGFGISAQQGQQHRPQQQNRYAIDKRDRNGAPDAESGGMSGFLAVALPQTAGDQAGAAHAKQIGQRGDEDEKRQCHGGGSYFVGDAQMAHKKGIRHIVNDGDDLADDGGHGQRGNGPADRHGIKQIFFTLGIIQDGFLFSASSTQSINR